MLLRGRASKLLDHPRALARVPLRLSVSVAAAAAALGVVRALEPALAIPVLFPAFVVIVVVSAGLAGTSYGIATMALFGVGYAYFFLEPRRGFGADDPRAVPILVAYAIAGVIVASVAGALRTAYARLREEHRAVTRTHEQREDLLKTLMHDVRSPLGTITMNATLLQRASEDPSVVLRRARGIEKSALSVASMLADLVETAHLESGHLRLERRPVELASFVVDLKDRLDGTLPVDRLSIAIPESLPAAHADPRRLERILVNLLSNALKYAPPPTPVVIGAAVREREVVVSVADRGPGISQEDLPHVFDKYFRARRAGTKDGLGIGLYATRMLVKLHDGRIWVESAVGEGTTFHVALPIAPSEERPVAPSATAGASDVPHAGAVQPPRARAPVKRFWTTSGNHLDSR